MNRRPAVRRSGSHGVGPLAMTLALLPPLPFPLWLSVSFRSTRNGNDDMFGINLDPKKVSKDDCEKGGGKV